MIGEAKREFVDLKVDEVSLVDSPANEMEFAIVKSLNKQEDNMAKDKKTEVTKAEEAETDAAAATPAPEAEVENVPVEVAKAESDAVQQAMDQVTDIVKGIAEQIKADKTEEEVTKSDGGDGGDGEEAPAADDAPAAEEESAAEDEETSDDAPASTTEEDEVEKTLDGLAAAIEKAKAFTPKRREQLEKAIEQLQVLLAGLNPVKPPQPMGQAPAVKTPGPGFMSGIQKMTEAIEGLTKALDDQQNKIGELVETNKNLNERIEDIEKTRQPSTSVDDEGDTDTETKTQKSFWSNVL